jgi:hypothetical protein
LRRDLGTEEVIDFEIISNDSATFALDSIVLAVAKWDMLGIYSKCEYQGRNAYEWAWTWAVIPPSEKGSRPDVVRKVIQAKLPQFASSDSVVVIDPMIISYIQARLLDALSYEYIYVQKNGENSFVAFGIRNTNWKPYDADAHRSQLYYATLKQA